MWLEGHKLINKDRGEQAKLTPPMWLEGHKLSNNKDRGEQAHYTTNVVRCQWFSLLPSIFVISNNKDRGEQAKLNHQCG